MNLCVNTEHVNETAHFAENKELTCVHLAGYMELTCVHLLNTQYDLRKGYYCMYVRIRQGRKVKLCVFAVSDYGRPSISGSIMIH